eukprot:CAMPEP_0201553468 /NCGR_PEP_ID=MMETSP0173_2-20130828/29033_1 /ASSEMBLY_ACC=CAM_ASM_000268 /TAXON_ID=218659 /ORGANISM="Vexillifera sp., Strain DIVA3 564/2" /LENGTH=217 /DNA_ID=CAMNT_0047964277 /DNA_START=21 /DNA_END=671 /DNA_ORIENTATION=+
MANNFHQGVLSKHGNMNYELHNLKKVWSLAVEHIKSVQPNDLRQKVNAALPGLEEKLTAQGNNPKNKETGKTEYSFEWKCPFTSIPTETIRYTARKIGQVYRMHTGNFYARLGCTQFHQTTLRRVVDAAIGLGCSHELVLAYQKTLQFSNADHYKDTVLHALKFVLSAPSVPFRPLESQEQGELWRHIAGEVQWKKLFKTKATKWPNRGIFEKAKET